MKTPKALSISVVIPALNEEQYLPSCLENLQKQEGDIPFEIVVVDNGSTDKTAEIAREYGARVVSEPHSGITYARQAGYQATQGDILACIDADTLAPPNWIQSIQRAFEKYPNAVALRGSFKYKVKSRLHRMIFWTVMNFFMPIVNLILRGQNLAGMNFAVTREALDKIGGFNLEVEFYGEDMELAHRLKKIGRIEPLECDVESSGRRFDNKGILIPGFIYVFNYLWLSIFKKPIFNFFDSAQEKKIITSKTIAPPSERKISQ